MCVLIYLVHAVIFLYHNTTRCLIRSTPIWYFSRIPPAGRARTSRPTSLALEPASGSPHTHPPTPHPARPQRVDDRLGERGLHPSVHHALHIPAGARVPHPYQPRFVRDIRQPRDLQSGGKVVLRAGGGRPAGTSLPETPEEEGRVVRKSSAYCVSSGPPKRSFTPPRPTLLKAVRINGVP